MKIGFLLLALTLGTGGLDSLAAVSTLEDFRSRLSSPDSALALAAARQIQTAPCLEQAERLSLAQLAIQHDDSGVRSVGYETVIWSLLEHTVLESNAPSEQEKSAARDARQSMFQPFRVEMPTIRNDILTGGPVVAGIAAELVMLGDGGHSFQQLVMQRATSSDESRTRNRVLLSFFALRDEPERVSEQSREALKHLLKIEQDMSVVGSAAMLLSFFDQSEVATWLIIKRIRIPSGADMLELLVNRPLTERQIEALKELEWLFLEWQSSRDQLGERLHKAFESLLGEQ